MLLNRIVHALNINDSTDREGTIKEISENIYLKGYNLWILVCSTVLASIGLDTNSTAVIIGAMLISPLMSPILGVGLAFGINDREMLFKSFRNLGLATLLSLVASIAYFLVTPLGEPTSELISRTRPTLLDVMIAFSGGVAGIISGSRKDKTNAIPGVAIATALMPPICTAGYGIAIGSISVFLGAFYLFFLNAVFISLATYFMVKYLHFPVKSYIDPRTQSRVRKIMFVLIAVIISPSAYFLFSTYQEISEKKKVEKLVVENIRANNNDIIKWEITRLDTGNVLRVYYSGEPLNNMNYYDSILKVNDINNYNLKIIRTNISKEEILKLSTEASSNLLSAYEAEEAKKTKMIAPQQDSVIADPVIIKKELNVFYPEITEVSLGVLKASDKDSSKNLTVIVKAPRKTKAAEEKLRKEKLTSYLKVKLPEDSINLLFIHTDLKK